MASVKRIPSFRTVRKKQVAAYIRVSSTMEKQDESYENQADYYEKKIKANPDWEFVGIYGEQISGTHAKNRTEFQRLIKDAMDGKIDLILCKSVSRWSRNIVDGLQAIKLLSGQGISIYFEQEDIDASEPGVLLQLNLAQSVAQSEAESISENLKWYYDNMARQGKYWARKSKYFGFDTNGDDFTENKDGKYVRFIFDSFLNGTPIEEIAEKLNDMGLKNNKGNTWSKANVKAILGHEVYVGDVIFHKTPRRNVITGEIDKSWKPKRMTDHHKGIISREKWDKAQNKLKGRSDKIPKRAEKEIAEKREPMNRAEQIRIRMDRCYKMVEGGCSRADKIAESMGLPLATVQYYLRKLERQGLIKSNNGLWGVC